MVNLKAKFNPLLQKLRSNRRGFIDSIIGVAVGVMILVAVLLAVAFFTEALPTVSDPVANQTITGAIAIGYQSLNIMGIAILISAVMAIIAVIMGAFYARNRGR